MILFPERFRDKDTLRRIQTALLKFPDSFINSEFHTDKLHTNTVCEWLAHFSINLVAIYIYDELNPMSETEAYHLHKERRKWIKENMIMS